MSSVWITRLRIFTAILPLLLLTRCLRTFNAVPQDALIEDLGPLPASDPAVQTTLSILQEQPISDGVLLFYRWQNQQTQGTNNWCAAITFTEQMSLLRGRGWVARSTLFLNPFSSDHQAQCTIAPDQFITGHIIQGETSEVTAAFGLAPYGAQVRVEWNDGQIDLLPLTSDSFLVTRDVPVAVRRIDLLDENDQVLASE